jgi:hypothetical protein
MVPAHHKWNLISGHDVLQNFGLPPGEAKLQHASYPIVVT